MIALNNGKAYISGKLLRKNILIDGGKISKISEQKLDAEKEIDCSGKIILPGAIDVHVHFRTPGFEYKEDWISGSLAALHGGITTVMDMPNTNPPTDSLQRLAEKRKLVLEDALVDFDLYMAATEGNLGEIEKAQNLRAVKLYFGSTTGNILLNKPEKIRELFKLAKEKNFIVVAHAEDEGIIKKNESQFRQDSHLKESKWPELHSLVRSEEAEAKAIADLLKIQEEIGNKLHIAHISSRKGVKLIEKAKLGKFGKNITCEVTPNHLLLCSNDYKNFGNLIKCNPSIKGPEHQKALFSALQRGTIDIVATDHAPHAPEEKARPYWNCPSGIPGVETMVPVLLDQVNKKRLALEKVVEVVCENPAKIFNWKNKGYIKEGYDADLIIVDMKTEYGMEDSRLFTKAKYSPFSKVKLKGFVEQTISRGEVYG